MNICDNREIINKGMFDVIVVGGVIVESVDGKEFFGAKAVISLILNLIRIICCSDVPRHILIFERCYLVIFLKGLYKIGTA